MDALVDSIRKRGGVVTFKSPVAELGDLGGGPIVVATSASGAASLLGSAAPDAARSLAGVELLSMVLVELFIEDDDRPVEGFGCLFPADAGFTALGVLFDHVVHPQRQINPAERWILGGSRSPDLGKLPDEALVQIATNDHVRLGGRTTVKGAAVTRRPNALPHYTVDLERRLAGLTVPDGIYLTGNYLGRIGLADILVRSNQVANQIAERYGP